MDMLCSEDYNLMPLYKIIKYDRDNPSKELSSSTSSFGYSLVMEYVDSMYYQHLYPLLTPREVQYYTYELLKAITYMHEKGIIHKDIKPHNVLIDREKKVLRLIDWGSADIYREGKYIGYHDDVT